MQTGQASNLCAVAFVFLAGCATSGPVARVQQFRAAKDRGDIAGAQTFIAPGARLYFEDLSGAGEPYTIKGGGRWDHWDNYFHSRSVMTNWRREGNAVTADVVETNDFMQLLDWRAKPYTTTWWVDASGRIEKVLIKSNPEKPVSRLAEFKEWAKVHHPDELAYLMPNGQIDPTGDRPERWTAILNEWKRGQ